MEQTLWEQLVLKNIDSPVQTFFEKNEILYIKTNYSILAFDTNRMNFKWSLELKQDHKHIPPKFLVEYENILVILRIIQNENIDLDSEEYPWIHYIEGISLEGKLLWTIESDFMPYGKQNPIGNIKNKVILAGDFLAKDFINPDEFNKYGTVYLDVRKGEISPFNPTPSFADRILFASEKQILAINETTLYDIKKEPPLKIINDALFYIDSKKHRVLLIYTSKGYEIHTIQKKNDLKKLPNIIDTNAINSIKIYDDYLIYFDNYNSNTLGIHCYHLPTNRYWNYKLENGKFEDLTVCENIVIVYLKDDEFLELNLNTGALIRIADELNEDYHERLYFTKNGHLITHYTDDFAVWQRKR